MKCCLFCPYIEDSANTLACMIVVNLVVVMSKRMSIYTCGISNYQFQYIPLILSWYYFDHSILNVKTVDNIQMNPCHTD